MVNASELVLQIVVKGSDLYLQFMFNDSGLDSDYGNASDLVLQIVVKGSDLYLQFIFNDSGLDFRL
ncbi:hypothetical protein J6590_035908, partial [Homalodisca vitripennis]